MAARVRSRVRVEGIVQGVGFRPFVHALAGRHGLTGFVGNDTDGVFAEVEGHPTAIDAFLAALTTEAPPLAVVERVRAEPIAPNGDAAFRIVESPRGGDRRTLISPDTATCEDCLRELFDPGDRRFRYPFLNCTNCGPRFTIVRDVPYDRPFTTMAAFDMCAACAREYGDPSDRRFHAQPTCCRACGPSLRLTAGASGSGAPVAVGDGALAGAVEMLDGGATVAIKGLGGYHLAADAASEEAVAALRGRKRREDKAFAILVPNLGAARELCEVDADEERILTDTRRPIVLLARRSGPTATVARSVAPRNRFLGVMLPYTPLHHLLAHDVGRALVLTSGNVSDEPIAYRDEDAFGRLAGIADAFLWHDRPIHIRTDDSVVRVVASRERPIRRSRGYVPRPVELPWALPRPLLACGAELKNTFAVAKGRRAFVSHHIGDLDDLETLRSFTRGIEHFGRIFDVAPEVVAHDLHPEYLSTRYALGMEGVRRTGVQHHHAHVASCLVDNAEEGPAIGVAFDGTGYGSDGTIWGGEFLVADLVGYQRVAHLEPVALPGGEAAIREPWRMAAAYLDGAYGEDAPGDLAVIERNRERWYGVVAALRGGLNSPPTSSAGRLFDAAAAILGVRDTIHYEGQAAIELEQLADPGAGGAYAVRLTDGADGILVVRGTDLIRSVVEDLRARIPLPVIAARFHAGLSDAIVAVVTTIADRSAVDTVALSGGVFQNLLLETRTVAALSAKGLRVLTHGRVPPNDGGISLGQVAVAGARDRAGRIDDGADDLGAAPPRTDGSAS
jgi:hydrogenase maturation protein HypF